MRKKHVFLTITAVVMLLAMVLSLAACGGGGNSGGGGSSSGSGNSGDNGGGGKTTTKEYTVDDVKKLMLPDLANYSGSKVDYAPTTTYTYDATTTKYDGKDCTEQKDKLQTRITDKTNDVNSGESTSAVIKIFTKSTPDGILTAIAKADLTYDEMVRVVDYIAGEEKADVGKYAEENKTTNTWTGLLTTTSSTLNSWTALKNDDGKDLNAGWSFFDDWELNERLQDYAKADKSVSKLSEGTGIKKTANSKAFGTKDIAGDNASWQYRSILEKIYKPASEGGVDLPGAVASRLATYMLEYAIEVVEGPDMANDTIESAVANGNASTFSTYFRTPIVEGSPYAALGDYDVLVYLLSFFDLYEGTPYSAFTGADAGLKSCVQLYGFYYQYNQTYYNVVLKDRARYTNQLKYEKLKEYTDTEWLDYVKIQRENYVGSYRYKESFYQTFYNVHFDFQGRKENNEKSVYVLSDAVSGRTYTGEMKKAIQAGKNGLKGQLAMSDWMWCYGGSDTNMKNYNQANTKYVEGKEQSAEKEYEGLFYYELEELKVVAYLINKMSDTELSGALYYNCYAYSGSMIDEMQGYAKDIILIDATIQKATDVTSIPTSEGIKETDKDAYATGKLTVLKAQAKSDWDGADVDTRATDSAKQPWNTMRGEIKSAQEWDYMALEKESSGDYTNVWKKRCDYLEDRVIAKTWSCCNQRVSEAKLADCKSGHASNTDGSTPTKEYDASQATSQFASKYETILMYVAAKAEVSFQTPTTGYHASTIAQGTYNVGYYGNVSGLADTVKGDSDGEKMKYKECNTMTLGIGSSFKESIIDEKGDDCDWWTTNSKASNINSFGPKEETETDAGNQKATYTYTYTFKGWYLDEGCKYVFNPDDDIDFNIKLYAGYDIVKSK